jgi:hypothetical protein
MALATGERFYAPGIAIHADDRVSRLTERDG